MDTDATVKKKEALSERVKKALSIDVGLFLLMLVNLKPTSIKYIWMPLEFVMRAGIVFSLIFIVIKFIQNRRKLPVLTIVLIGLETWVLIMTAIFSKFNWYNIEACISITAVAMIVDYYSDRPLTMLRTLMLNFEILIYINVVTILIWYPEGMYLSANDAFESYFLAFRNAFIVFALPAVCIALQYIHCTGKKLRSFILIAAALIPIFALKSVTSMVAVAVGVIFMLLKKPLQKKTKFWPFFIALLVVDILVTVVRIVDRVPFIADFITNVLHKDVTLTGRTYTWDVFYGLFLKSPVFGYGTGHDITTVAYTVHHAHNMYFQQLYLGGIPALGAFLFIMWKAGRSLDSSEDRNGAYLFLCVMITLMTAFVADTYMYSAIFMLFPLMMRADRFKPLLSEDRKCREKKENAEGQALSGD